MNLKFLLGVLVLLLCFPFVLGGLFSPTPPPPMVGPPGPTGPQGPAGPPGNYTIGNGLLLVNNGTEIQVNFSMLDGLYNDTYLILFVNSSLSSRIDNIDSQLINISLNISDLYSGMNALNQTLQNDYYNKTESGNRFYPLNSNPASYINDSYANSTYYLQTNPAGYINDSYANGTYYPLNNNPAGYLTNASLNNLTNGTWVRVTGDSMTGDLNMTNHSIVGVDVLEVHNITGRSPVYINSPLISGSSINATNIYGSFFGDINGQNGTIFGMTITNGKISNLTVIDNMYVDTNATFNGSLIPAINDTYTLGILDKYWKSFYVTNLYAGNISTPDIDYLINITNQILLDLDNKLNITDQRYNDTSLIQIINATIKQPIGPYIINDSTYFQINETYLNNTINNISKVRKVIYNMTCTALSGMCTMLSAINISYQITEVKVIPTTLSNDYKFQLTEYPTANIIDKDRAVHHGVWDIEKNYAIDGAVQANITNANIDELFTVSIIYLTNGVS